MSGADILLSQRGVHEKRMKLQDLLGEVLPPNVELGVVRVTVGSPAEVILEAAKSLDVDLIALGAHRTRKFADRVIGSTAELVLREATVPCLMLNRPLTLPVSRAVVPSDFSGPSARAIEAALGWIGISGQAGQTQVTLTHVVDSAMDAKETDWREQELVDDLLESANVAREGINGQIPIDTAVLHGEDVAGELIRHAEESGADLIVMGTRGDGVLVRALLGSVSSAIVRRSPIPVMLVPRPLGAVPDVRRSAAAARTQPIQPVQL